MARAAMCYRSCFYRSLPTGELTDAPVALTYEEDEKVFDPLDVYTRRPQSDQALGFNL